MSGCCQLPQWVGGIGPAACSEVLSACPTGLVNKSCCAFGPPNNGREENYNKHFKNGGAGERVLDVAAALGSQQSVVDWMLPRRRTGEREAGGSGGGGGGGIGGGAVQQALPPIGTTRQQSLGRAAGALRSPSGGGGSRSLKGSAVLGGAGSGGTGGGSFKASPAGR